MTKTVVVSGSSGLVGSEAVRYYLDRGYRVVGIDNNLRQYFFGYDGNTMLNRYEFEDTQNYKHYDLDIRKDIVELPFSNYGSEIEIVLHCAAQPSHDWAAKEPITDFSVNALGTLHMLEATRKYCNEASFIHVSTSKVYGDRPNSLPLEERESRYEVDCLHPYADGIKEDMPIDQCLHSLFGASKASGDLMAQEYARYFGMNIGIFRPGCLTGPRHAGAELHGFLSYLMKCCEIGRQYTVYGYKGKQVRDNIHSYDLIRAFDCFAQDPRPGEVYNMGGGRENNCSMIEAIVMCEEITGKKLKYEYVETPRIGDHIWWIGSNEKFQSHYPHWQLTKSIHDILCDIYQATLEKFTFYEEGKKNGAYD